MQEENLTLKEMAEKEPEQRSSPPPPSDLEDRDASAQQQRYSFSEGCEMATDLAIKLEEVQNLPIMKKPRIVNLVAKFSNFP